ncbi:MAG: pantoate--beta-alanine ligase [Candidatus Eremiobacterota bacterium]
MKLLRDLPELRAWRAEQSAPVGFVPTMGYLHEGHLELVRRARRETACALVSIFVNPTQFGPAEDLDSYPRDLQRDVDLCREAGAEAVYAPEPADVYWPDATTWVEVHGLDRPLCGRFREGHFRGVATVVAKLVHRVQPRKAYFGEKDFQQLTIIRRMVRDLDFPLEVVPVPTVREPDGLAMSSRNVRLSPDGRQRATALFAALTTAREAVERGERDAEAAVSAAGQVLRGAGIEPQYLELVQADNLEPASNPLAGRLVLAVAAFVDGVRLIDNLRIEVGE